LDEFQISGGAVGLQTVAGGEGFAGDQAAIRRASRRYEPELMAFGGFVGTAYLGKGMVTN
jgi:hypothetical protein